MKITPYPYQDEALAKIWDCLDSNPYERPCLQFPTGSGKGYLVAFFSQEARRRNSRARIMIVVDNQDLIAENYAKMIRLWPNAPCGMYSAGLRRRDLGYPIVHVGVQSARGKADHFGHYDYILIDEAHMVSHKEEQGEYRKFLNDMAAINPSTRFIGLTATPWRLGHTGHIAEGGAFFTKLIKGPSIDELVTLGFLSTLHSKHMANRYDVSAVKKRGGEYIEKDLQEAINVESQNVDVVNETIALATSLGCKSWVVFCSGVEHAKAITVLLVERGISAKCLTGETPKAERSQMIDDFKAGKFTAFVSVEVLIKGFDHPAADLGVMLRPTKSKSFYVQMVGRLMRVAAGKVCGYILDFAGLVNEHGPVTLVEAEYKDKNVGEAPVKPCPECHEIIGLSIMVCPECGYVFVPPKPAEIFLDNKDIMKVTVEEMTVTWWFWRVMNSKKGDIPMAVVDYYGYGRDEKITEFLTVNHGGYFGSLNQQKLIEIATKAEVSLGGLDGLEAIMEALNGGQPPKTIKHKKDGAYIKVLSRSWD